MRRSIVYRWTPSVGLCRFLKPNIKWSHSRYPPPPHTHTHLQLHKHPHRQRPKPPFSIMNMNESITNPTVCQIWREVFTKLNVLWGGLWFLTADSQVHHNHELWFNAWAETEIHRHRRRNEEPLSLKVTHHARKVNAISSPPDPSAIFWWNVKTGASI